MWSSFLLCVFHHRKKKKGMHIDYRKLGNTKKIITKKRITYKLIAALWVKVLLLCVHMYMQMCMHKYICIWKVIFHKIAFLLYVKII